MMQVMHRRIDQLLTRGAQSDGRHLQPVNGTLAAQALRLPVLVRERDLRIVQIEMARFGGKIERFERTTTFLVDDIERLDKLDVIAHFDIGASPPPLVAVHHIGRTADGRENEIASPDLEIVRRIARRKREFKRCFMTSIL